MEHFVRKISLTYSLTIFYPFHPLFQASYAGYYDENIQDMDGIRQSEEEKGYSCSPYENAANSGRFSPIPIDGAKKGSERLASGGEKGGFVVYKQTVDLVNMLEKSIVVDEM